VPYDRHKSCYGSSNWLIRRTDGAEYRVRRRRAVVCGSASSVRCCTCLPGGAGGSGLRRGRARRCRCVFEALEEFALQDGAEAVVDLEEDQVKSAVVTHLRWQKARVADLLRLRERRRCRRPLHQESIHPRATSHRYKSSPANIGPAEAAPLPDSGAFA
jgi:hypothetical protein